jgi:hypothetical protein
MSENTLHEVKFDGPAWTQQDIERAARELDAAIFALVWEGVGG